VWRKQWCDSLVGRDRVSVVGNQDCVVRVFAFRHDGQSPLVLASERSILNGDGLEVVVGASMTKGFSPKDDLPERGDQGIHDEPGGRCNC